MKIAAIDGPCKGDFYSIEDEAEFSYKAGDILIMIRKRDFKINPFWQDVHDVFNPHNQINPIVSENYKYIILKNKTNELYLKYVP